MKEIMNGETDGKKKQNERNNERGEQTERKAE